MFLILNLIKVTPEEKKAAVKTSRIMRTSRKTKGWTQVEFSKMLGVSQSALSKLESGILIPSVHQWFEFCGFAEIPADSHVTGYLDRLQEIQFQSKIEVENFKVKKDYLIDAASSARSMSPLIQWLYSSVGESKARKLIKEMGVDADYFVDLSHTINFRFFVDLMDALKKKGLLKKQGLSTVTQFASTKGSHGSLFSNYQNSNDIENLMKLVFSKSEFYECNFEYRIENSGSKQVEFSVAPREHLLKNRSLKFDEVSDLLAEYRAGYFKSVLEGTLHPSTSHELTCISQDPNKSVFQIALT
jgi:transcriptional regulator with XRE-family HTH domain